MRRGSEDDWQQLLMHNRSCLRRLLGKIARGEAITVASYGDSTVAVQLGTPPYTANGTTRDRPENYLISMPADTVAALPKYDFGDGAGQVHVKISAPWSLIAALEQASGQPATYLNFGRGGPPPPTAWTMACGRPGCSRCWIPGQKCCCCTSA